jgi:hypothetical protein
MRKFHTYTKTPNGISRGLNSFNNIVMSKVSLEKEVSNVIKKKGFCSILEIGTGKGTLLLELCNLFKKIVFV